MLIISKDKKRMLDIDDIRVWNSIYYTARHIYKEKEDCIQNALKFFESKYCDSGHCYSTAREFNLIRDSFSQLKPDQMIYDVENPEKKPSFLKNLSPVVTSLGNLYTTADGKDLLFEIVSILTYGQIIGTDIEIEEGL